MTTSDERKYILSIDIGTTTVRACLYNLSYELLSYEQIQVTFHFLWILQIFTFFSLALSGMF